MQSLSPLFFAILLLIQVTFTFQYSSGIVKVSSFSDFQHHVQENNFRSGVYWVNGADGAKLFEPSFSQYLTKSKFDGSIQYKIKEFNETTFWQLIPEIHRGPSMNALVQDMVALAKVLSLAARSSDDRIHCRLHLMDSVRCPKWHEDDVECRLFKTYYGHGTQFVDPDDKIVRFENYIRSIFNQDRTVSDHFKVDQIVGGDVFLMSGKKRATRVPHSIPVLHRSPLEVDKTRRRLLYTVTLNN